METEEKKIRKKVRKKRQKVTLVLVIFASILTLITLCIVGSLNRELLFYFVGIISGFIGLIARSISMWNHIDYKIINKKYVLDGVDEQCKTIISAYYFKYPIFMILTILAFISLTILTLDNKFFNKPFISLILIFAISMLVGFFLKSPKDLS